jgi:phosphatidylglycerol:prolipoprotein diacylglycerol transferase
MHPEILHLGSLTVYSYGLMVAIGILTAYYVAEKRMKKFNIDPSRFQYLVLTAIISGALGSKFLYFLTRFHDIMQDPGILFSLSDGWVVYGGILGGILGGYIYCRLHNLDFVRYFDFMIPEVALAQGFGRIGCFLAGCCYGAETDQWFGIVFPTNSLAPSGVALIPTQLLMSAFDFLLAFLLFYLAKKDRPQGTLASVYLIAYSLGRFVIEYLRGDMIRGSVGVLSTSQLISLFTFAAGVIWLIWLHMRAKKQTV